jgi:hypothetical protein
MVVSFHNEKFLRPLLHDLPGADWRIRHNTMARQVEDLVSNDRASRRPANNSLNNLDGEFCEDASTSRVIASVRSQQKNDLNVFRCTRQFTDTPSRLQFGLVHQHILVTNNQWFSEENPMLTLKRRKDLEASFAGREKLNMQEAYNALFTEIERDHFTFDLFLEDWRSHVTEKVDDADIFMSLDEAVTFLEEMQ